MKTLEYGPYQLYESNDCLPVKWFKFIFTRLTVGKEYIIKGVCHVPQTTTSSGKVIPEWDGILLESKATGKLFPVALSTLTGTGFIKNNDGKYTIIRTSKISFEDIEDILCCESFTVMEVEKMKVTDFNNEEITKDFYLFTDIVYLPKGKERKYKAI